MSIVGVTVGVSNAEVAAAATEDCPDWAPDELALQPGGAAASDILVCTDAQWSAVTFLNEGDFVWLITVPVAGVRVDQHTRTIEANLRRAAIGNVYRHAVLGPDTRVTVHAYPSDVTITPDDHLSTLWWTHELLGDIISEKVGEWATMAASQRSKAAGTLATCAVAAADAVGDLDTLGTEDDGAEQFLAATGLTSSVGACATSWARLRDNVGGLPSWRRGVISLTSTAGLLDDADSFLTHWNILRKLVPRLP